ncbi:lytic transglycosylase domain-containing protein, partial [Streptomyces lutosisoli]
KTNPKTQIKWGLDYMNSRYGSPAAAWNFWQANGWY